MVLFRNEEISVHFKSDGEYVTFEDNAWSVVALTRDESIAAARAILKHFGEEV